MSDFHVMMKLDINNDKRTYKVVLAVIDDRKGTLTRFMDFVYTGSEDLPNLMDRLVQATRDTWVNVDRQSWNNTILFDIENEDKMCQFLNIAVLDLAFRFYGFWT